MDKRKVCLKINDIVTLFDISFRVDKNDLDILVNDKLVAFIDIRRHRLEYVDSYETSDYFIIVERS